MKLVQGVPRLHPTVAPIGSWNLERDLSGSKDGWMKWMLYKERSSLSGAKLKIDEKDDFRNIFIYKMVKLLNGVILHMATWCQCCLKIHLVSLVV